VCPCIQNVAYALSRSEIPTTIFCNYICSAHRREEHNKDAPIDKRYVQCFLAPDGLLTGTEEIDTWSETYYAGSMASILSVLTHGELLMDGDFDINGNQVGLPANASQRSSILTHKTIESALESPEAATFDKDQTSMQAILQLRQRPGSFSECGTKWSTVRRGTIYIESLIVHVLKSTSVTVELPVVTAILPTLYLMKFKCREQQLAFNFLKKYGIPPEMFNSAYNRCYCRQCYPKDQPMHKTVGGKNYTIPTEWVRFGLAVNPVFAAINDPWKSWNTAYHGCRVDAVESILRHRTLLIPKDILYNGTTLGATNSAEPNLTSYFLTPSINHAASPRFGQHVQLDDLVYQVAIVFKVRYGI